MTDPPDKRDDAEPDIKQGKVSKRIWFLLFFISLFGALFFLVGTSAPNDLLKKQIDKVLSNQGLEGEVNLSGNLASGYTLSDLHLSGDKGIQKLKARKLKVQYTLKDLLQKKIDLVEAEDLEVVIDIARFEKKEKEPKEKKNVHQILESIRPWVTNPELSLKNVDLTILKNSELVTQFTFDSLLHENGTDLFQLSGFSAQNAKKQKTAPQDINLSWGEQSLSLDRWEFLPNLELKNTEYSWVDEPTGTAELKIGAAQLEAELNDTASFNLVNGLLDTDFLKESLNLDLPIQAEISALKAEIKNWRKPIPEWNANATLKAEKASYEKYELKSTNLQFTQQDSKYKLNIDGSLNSAPTAIKLEGKWNSSDDDSKKSWWQNTEANYTLNSSQLNGIIEPWAKKVPLFSFGNTKLNLEGKMQLRDANLNNLTSKGKITGVQVEGTRIPALSITAELAKNTLDSSLSVEQPQGSEIKLDSVYHLKEKTYDGEFILNGNEQSWINKLIQQAKSDLSLQGRSEIKWQGNGSLAEQFTKSNHQGSLAIQQLTLKVGKEEPIAVASSAQYDLPNSANFDSLKIQKGDFQLDGEGNWNGQKIVIPSLSLFHQTKNYATLSANVPYSVKVTSLDDFLAQKDPILLDLNTEQISLSELRPLLPEKISPELSAKSKAKILLTGTVSEPILKGNINVFDLRGLNPKLQQPFALTLDLASQQEKLNFQLQVTEGANERLKAKGLFPLDHLNWIKKPDTFLDSVQNSTLSATASVKEFPLDEIAKFVPQLEKIDGSISAEGEFSGSVKNPKYQLDLDASIPLVELTSTEIGQIKDLRLKSSMTENKVIENSLNAQINGGKLEITGTVDLNEPKNPGFNLRARCENALVFRDDLVSLRTNADLNLTGKLEEATINGAVGIVESLVYKDIELIPIGVPSSEVSNVSLPSIDAKRGDSFPVPAPFSRWKLDINLTTEDPILIRGNVASGLVEGGVKVSGTLSTPKADGIFNIKDTQARLPFSVLEVDAGEIIFTQETNILNPKLNIPGKSSISGYEINALVYGTPATPKTNLTSYPPLPEAEIMSLLATGATTESLENGGAVALKAFQLFLLRLKEEDQLSAGNALFEALLTSLDKLDLQIGSNNKFTGRKFTSASLELSERWGVTAQIDEERFARGLLVYLLRFK